MSQHPLDHALVVTQIRPRRTFQHDRGGGAVKTSLNSGGLAPLMISLDPRFCPQKIILIYEQDEKETARTIEKLLKQLEISVEHCSVNLAQVEESVYRLDKFLDHQKHPLPVCLNGDHPLLSTICSSVFQRRNYPVLTCVDGDLYRLGARPQKIKLEPQIELESLIALLGARTQPGWEGIWFEEHLETLSQFLISAAHNCTVPLEIIKRLAKEARNRDLLSPPVKGTEIAIPLFQETLDRFESAGCVELNQGRLLFSSEQHRAYCAGGWLSLYAQAALSKLPAEQKVWAVRQDILIELAYPTPMERNIPLIAFVNSHLMFFFCVSSASMTLNELLDDTEVLSVRFGAIILILSTDNLHDDVTQRARRQNIYLCQGDQLKTVDQWLIKEVLD